MRYVCEYPLHAKTSRDESSIRVQRVKVDTLEQLEEHLRYTLRYGTELIRCYVEEDDLNARHLNRSANA